MPQTLPEWLEYIERQHPKTIDMGLDRVRAVAARLGLKKPAKQVITVGGIHGKVVGTTEGVLTLEIADNVKVKVERASIQSTKTPGKAE